jgi:hypothetical protein
LVVHWQKQKHQIHWIKYFIIWISKIVWNWSIKNELCDANIELAYSYNKIFNPVNLVFLFLSMHDQFFAKQLMKIFNTSISNYLKKHILKFFRQNNYTKKAKILYFFNLVYILSLVALAYDKIMWFIYHWPAICHARRRHLQIE